jgi:hypothetical protein
MAPPSPVKKLAAQLVAQGIESQYLARVLAKVTPDDQLETLQAEIAREIAGALGRSEDKVNMALAQLELLRARYEQAVREHAPASEQQARADAFNAQRDVAQARRHQLLIHREAIGIRRNQILYELYPVPQKLAPKF